MICPRLKHFVRLNPNGTVGRCGHMHKPPEFTDLTEMQNSEWQSKVQRQMDSGKWPIECIRCMNTEKISNKSVRLDALQRDKILKNYNTDYLVVGGVLDNVCNSACQTCNSSLSTKIGSLSGAYQKVDNLKNFYGLPQGRIVEIDINGGEPTYSKNYSKLMNDLPTSTRLVRINTNCSSYYDTIEKLIEKKIMIVLTVSLDGIGDVHDYVRWPIKWKDFEKNLMRYRELSEKSKFLRLDTWTTLSVLNIKNFPDILAYAKDKNLEHAYALLERPYDLSIKRRNTITEFFQKKFLELDSTILKNIAESMCVDDENNNKDLDRLIKYNDKIRSISYQDYLSLPLNRL